MSSPLIPPEAELRRLYAEQIANADVRAVSCWNECNHSEPSDDEAYVARALADGPVLMAKFDRIIDGI